MSTSEEVIKAANKIDLSYLVQNQNLKKLPSVNIFELLEEYRRFLIIKVVARDTAAPINLSPSALIDKVWHEHLQHTAKYREACSVLGQGVFIDHDPDGALSSRSLREKRPLLTKTYYSIIFNQPAPVKYWGLEYEVADTVDLINESDSSDDGRDNRKGGSKDKVDRGGLKKR